MSLRIDEIETAPADLRHVRISDGGIGLEVHLAIERGAELPAFGGIRRRRYVDAAEATAEVQALARGMGKKLAFAGLESAGAKAVILDHDRLDRARAYEALAEAMVRLGPIWVAGPDLGTTESDLDRLRDRVTTVNAPGNEPGRSTARGVFRAMRAALAEEGEEAALEDRIVLVQGLGSVGRELAWLLLEAGAQVRVQDLDQARAEAFLAAEVERGRGLRVLPAGPVADLEVEVFAPCAVGGQIDRDYLERTRHRLICGSANEQLAGEELASLLATARPLYLPDFCVNAGAVIEGVLVHHRGEAGREQADAIIEATGERIADLLRQARSRGASPYELALAMVAERRR